MCFCVRRSNNNSKKRRLASVVCTVVVDDYKCFVDDIEPQQRRKSTHGKPKITCREAHTT